MPKKCQKRPKSKKGSVGKKVPKGAKKSPKVPTIGKGYQKVAKKVKKEEEEKKSYVCLFMVYLNQTVNVLL